MTVKEAHILVDQDLQELGFFQNGGVLKEELDLHFTRELNGIIDDIISPYKEKNSFDINQEKLDLLNKLYVTDVELTPTQVSSAPEPHYKVDLKAFGINYLVLLQSRSKVATTCLVHGVSTTTNQINPNRNPYSLSNVATLLKTSLSKTSKNKPATSLADDVLRMYYDNTFTISKVYVDYIKEPTDIIYSKILTASMTAGSPILSVLANIKGLVIGMKVTGTNIPANTTILNIISATSITLSANTTGAGTTTQTLTFGGDGDTELPLNRIGNNLLVANVVKHLAIITQQNQQKIVNLEQE